MNSKLMRKCVSQIILVGVVSCALAGSSPAQTITNPSFEADTFTAFPGYYTQAGNGPITGWTASGGAGLNPAAGSPFADNGAIPAGSQVAFIQNSPSSSLSTVISGLTVGLTYKVNFRVNARSGNTPALKVDIDGNNIINTAVTSVGGANPYKYFAFDFVAPTTSPTMTLRSDSGGDNTVVLDDFSIAVRDSGWSYAPWNNDATSGVDGTETYTHAFSFGSTVNTTINGVLFTGVGGGNPSGPTFSTTGLPHVFNDDANSITGGSRQLANDFLYNGFPATITINGLLPGAEYVATIYSVGWENGTRAATFSVGNDRLTVNQDHFGDNNGIRFIYRYIATGTSITLTYTPLEGNSIHTYGFSNYELKPTLLTDNFTGTGTPNTLDLNYNLAGRQTGTVAPTTYTLSPGGNCQVGNGGEPHDGGNVLLCAFGSNAALDRNFNNTLSAGGLKMSFELDPNSHNNTLDNWGAVTIGSAQADRNTFVVSGTPHFGILFRANGHIQAFDGGTGVSGPTEPNWLPDGDYSGQLHRITLIMTDPGDGNPFDGSGDTRIEVFVDGGNTPVFSFTKTGGYADNYINFQDSYIGDFENLVISQISPPASAPLILIQPQGRCVSAGQPFSLTGLAGGAPAPAYQWQKNGADIGGATSRILSFASATGTDEGNYTLIASNASGMATSSVAVVKVGLGLVNPSFEADTFTTFPGYTSQAGNGPITGWSAQGGHGLNPAAGSPFADNGAIPDRNQVAFMQQDGPLSQMVSGFTVGAQYYVVYSENARSGGVPAMEVQIDGVTIVPVHTRAPVGGANPYIEVTSDAFTATATDLLLSFIKSNPLGGDTTALIDNVCVLPLPAGTPPIITRQPQPLTVNVGDSASFSVGALGSLPLTYQWRKNDVNIGNATNSTLTFNTVAKSAEADYTVVIANTSGSVTSVVAHLTVYEFISTLFNTGLDTNHLALADNSVDPHYTLTTNPDTGLPDAIVEDSAAFPIVGGPWLADTASSKWIGPRFNTSPSAVGLYTYRTTFDLTNRDPSTVVIIGRWASDNSGRDILVNGVSTGNPQSPSFAGYTGFLISTSNASFLPGVNTIDFVVENEAAPGYTGLRAEFTTSNARILPNIPPTITTQPVSQTAVIESNTVTFTVSASGSDPVTYQWSKNGTPLPGQTNSVLTLFNVTTNDNGLYRARATNDFGFADSNPAQLAVIYRRVPGIYSTGVENNGALAADGSIDLHWIIGNSADLGFPGPDAFVINQGASPVPPWLSAGPKSKWIAPQPNQNAGNAEGNYTYQTFFDLTGVDMCTFRLAGQISVDNSLVDIVVNGLSQGISGGGFTFWLPFTITNGFVAGLNGVDFIMNNAPATPNPTALRVDLDGLVRIRDIVAPTLAISRIAPDTLSISWVPTGGCDQLQSAPDVTGPWTTIGTVSPTTVNTALAPAAFFRVRP